MDNNEAKKLILMTENFYKSVQSEFDATRQGGWKGWEAVLDIIKKQFTDKEFSIADIGCGNGRFLENILNDSEFRKFYYTGFDSNEFLLKKAQEKFSVLPNVKFLNIDCVSNLKEIENKFDVVTAFGLTHHIPFSLHREEWFKQLASLIRANGLLIFSNWQINSIENFEDKIIKTDYNLEASDYILGWNNSDAKRYVHIYDDAEMKKIEYIFKSLNLKLIKNFENDGRNSKLNKYFIFQNVYS